ncbi:glycosyltransferase family 2 protein, partial [Silanimonas lenta]|uniref:glycosyltransferase family 2 protein n=1 Tax=Silanimonas lenta TaxID=265429 RepID=UPI002FE3E97B
MVMSDVSGARKQSFDGLVIIPAYNEESMISTVVGKLRTLGYEVLVVDDGSKDHTAQQAKQAGARVVVHPVNLGQGAALQTGFDYALRSGFTSVITFDADDQHDPGDIKRLHECMQQESADYVLGSRFIGKVDGMSPARYWLLRAAVWFTRLTSGMRLTDAHNGLRLITARGLNHISLRQNRMAHASEILEQIASSGLRYGRSDQRTLILGFQHQRAG